MFFCLWNNDWEKHAEPEKPCDSTHLTETTEGMCWRKGHNSLFSKSNKGRQHWDHGAMYGQGCKREEKNTQGSILPWVSGTCAPAQVLQRGHWPQFHNLLQR